MVAVLAVLGAIEAGRLYTAYDDLHAGTAGLRAAARDVGSDSSHWTPADVAAARQEVVSARARIARGRVRLEGDALLSATSGLPELGEQALAARDLAAAADESGQASSALVDVADIYVSSSGTSPARRLAEFMSRAGPLLGQAQGHLDHAHALVERDRALSLLPPLRDQVDRAAADIADAQAALDRVTRLP